MVKTSCDRERNGKIDRQVQRQCDPTGRQRPERQSDALQKKQPHQTRSAPCDPVLATRQRWILSDDVGKNPAGDPSQDR